MRGSSFDKYPEITAIYKETDKNTNNDPVAILKQRDNQYKHRVSYMVKEIEVIEKFDNDMLDNMIQNDSLNQRFKSKSLPSL